MFFRHVQIVPEPRDSHFQRSFGTQVHLHHVLQALGSRDVDGQRLGGTGKLSLGVQQANRRHFRGVFFKLRERYAIQRRMCDGVRLTWDAERWQ